MALFKIAKGLKANLPSTKTAGHCWYTTDDSLFYIDYEDENGVVQRKALNSQDAETICGASLATILNSSNVEIPTSKAVLNALAGKANTSHDHNDKYYTETEMDTKLAAKSDTTHKHDDAYDTKGAAAAVQDSLNIAVGDLAELQDLVGTTKVSTQITDAINGITHPIYVSEENQESAVVPLNADTFNGMPPSYYAKTDEAMIVELLWSNASPRSEFVGQTVSVSASGYDMFWVVFARSTTAYFYLSTLFPVFGGSTISLYFGDAGFGGHRDITGSDANNIVFGNATYNGQKNQNTNFIPYRIYGVKGVTV